ncbi:MAG: N-6 DNA methylase, partial [Propionibacteriaceae bacterium]|nr:N-6 DNA methylase [Propionibacteriaceae bacterium]
DGPKNRLREQDIHRIVDTFAKQAEIPRYSRLVPVTEIADPKNDYNLNLPRYIDSSEPEDLQDIDGHLRGGIPDRDLNALDAYWQVLPSVRAALFESAGRPGYSRLKVPIAEVKATILGHPEFAAFNESATRLFDQWKDATRPRLESLKKGDHPKALIETIAEELLAAFRGAPLLDAYDVYQHLMDYWAETMQDDCYLIAADGWKAGAQPREIVQTKNKDGKLAWPEGHDFKKGKRRFKSDLIPASILVVRNFRAQQAGIGTLEAELASIEQQLEELKGEQGGEEGLLAEVVEGEGDKQKITTKAIKARLKDIGLDQEFAEERAALEGYAALLDRQAHLRAKVKEAQDDIEANLDAKYPKLTDDEIKGLVVGDKWLNALTGALQGELDRVSQTVTGRVRQLAERYATTLPELGEKVTALAERVDGHLKKMGTAWR